MSDNNFNLFLAVFLSIVVLFGWHYFFEKPKIQNEIANQRRQAEIDKNLNIKTEIEDSKILSRDDILSNSDRIPIRTRKLSGSLNLKGLRFDDLILNNYKISTYPASKNVILLSPAKTKDSYFVEFGWVSPDNTVDLPNANSLWETDSSEITTGKRVTFKWKSSQNVTFTVVINVDDFYMFTIDQNILNQSDRPIIIKPYGLVQKAHDMQNNTSMSVVHEGVIGVVQGSLKEVTYKDLKSDVKVSNGFTKLDWIGITDKYWQSVIIPDKKLEYNSNFTYANYNGLDKFQSEFLGYVQTINHGEDFSITNYLFTGAKKINTLDYYESKLNISLFDRSVDFGWFYILTKPMLKVLHAINNVVENFGISILILTVIIKLLLFNLSNKSFKSMKKMRELAPEIERIKELYSEDKTKQNMEVMALYKRNKVNPFLSGCLPILIQIPVFFSLYKVLNVSIEMRHAPFFGWINDLSSPDPTTIFNLFGLLPFTPPNFLMIGAWPILMAATMYIQQLMSPPPADPAQAQAMKFMPLIFLFMFSSFPAGLLIYWTWNNILSIGQQSLINKFSK